MVRFSDHRQKQPPREMVSVADEQGRLVLVGVDAVYCVVDEVDTTASTLHDQYLQQVRLNIYFHSCQPSRISQESPGF